MKMNANRGTSLKRTLTVISLILAATVLVYCRPWKHKSPEERAEWMTKRVTKELDLNDPQKQTLAKIKDELLAKYKADKPARDALFQEMTALVQAESIDKAKLQDLKKRHVAQREAIENLFLDKVVEFHKVLTPEQRTKAAKSLEKHAKHFSGEK